MTDKNVGSSAQVPTVRMTAVNAQLAFVVRCPHCRTRFYVDAIPAELDGDERAETEGMDPTSWVTYPDTVDCPECDATLSIESCEQEPL